MNKKVEAVLSAEEWIAVQHDFAVTGGLDLDYDARIEDGNGIRLEPRHRSLDWPGVVAVANDFLELDDPRKITREMIDALRKAHLEFGQTNDVTDCLLSIADALESYLPPTEPKPPDSTSGGGGRMGWKGLPP